MSTRGCYRFTDERDCLTVYKHSDNYPYTQHGGVAAIRKATAYAWPLPRFEADEFAAAFVTANKDVAGGVRLLNTPDSKTLAHMPGDIEYLYDITANKYGLHIVVSEIIRPKGWESDEMEAKSLYEGSLDGATHYFAEWPKDDAA